RHVFAPVHVFVVARPVGRRRPALPPPPHLEVGFDKAFGSQGPRHPVTQQRVEKGGTGGVFGIDREALAQLVPRGFGAAPQLGQGGPGALGGDVIGRERRDAAPVVEARGGQSVVAVRGEVGRRLNGHVRTQQGARHRERADQVLRRER